MNRNRSFILLTAVAAVCVSAAIYFTPVEISEDEGASDVQYRNVLVRNLKPGNHQVSWRTGGVVSPAQATTLSAQVEGRLQVLDEQALPGSHHFKGQYLATIEPQDYELKLRLAQADLAIAKANLEVEQGLQGLAAEEIKLANKWLGSDKDRALALRQPQRDIAAAQYQKAEADYKQSLLDLERTEISLPFNAVITAKHADAGHMLSIGSPIFDIASTHEFWVRAKVPMHFLRWLNDESRVTVTHPSWPNGFVREGKILKTLADVDPVDRQPRLLIAIENPFDQNPSTPKLLLNQYVDIEVNSPLPEKTIKLERDWMPDATHVWLLSSNQKLKRTAISPIYTSREHILVEAAELQSLPVVTTRLVIAADGMQVTPIYDQITSDIAKQPPLLTEVRL